MPSAKLSAIREEATEQEPELYATKVVHPVRADCVGAPRLAVGTGVGNAHGCCVGAAVGLVGAGVGENEGLLGRGVGWGVGLVGDGDGWEDGAVGEGDGGPGHTCRP